MMPLRLWRDVEFRLWWMEQHSRFAISVGERMWAMKIRHYDIAIPVEAADG